MVSGLERELFKSKVDPCEVCGRRVMANSVPCTKCKNSVHGRCAKIKRVTARLAMHFIFSKCKGIMEETVNSIEKVCDEVETVNGFCYLGDRIILVVVVKRQSQQGPDGRCFLAAWAVSTSFRNVR